MIPPLLVIALAAPSVLSPSAPVLQETREPPPRVAEVSRLEFHSSFWLNLHHTLYAAAWARRPEAGTLRARAGALPAPLDAPLSDEERQAWTTAVDFYDRELANRDLLFDRRLSQMKPLLSRGNVSAPEVGDDVRKVLQQAAPVYRKHYWPAHDRVNRAWIDATVNDIRQVAPEVIGKLERFYGVKWFDSPVRIDVVWIGNRQGAYTTTEPVHAVIAAGVPDHKGWNSVEIVFHEISHKLIHPLEADLSKVLGERVKQHRDLWHVVQFYLTGAAVQQTLRVRKIEYTPFLYQGLIDRAWPQYRDVVDKVWRLYADGVIDRDEAVRRTVTLVTLPRQPARRSREARRRVSDRRQVTRR